MELDIFGRTTQVIFKEKFDHEDQDKHAYFDTEDKNIYFDRSSTKNKTVMLIHEMFHAMVDRLNLQMSEELEEQLCENVGDMIYENLTEINQLTND